MHLLPFRQLWIWVAVTTMFVTLTPAVSVPQSEKDGDQRPSTRRAKTLTGASGETVRQKVEYALTGYDFEADRSTLNEIGPTQKVVRALKHLVSDDEAQVSLRTRAAELLGLYDEVDGLASFAVEQLDKQADRLNNQSLSRIQRHTADILAQNLFETVARLAPDDKAADTLEPFLSHTDLQRRLSALHALGRHAGEPGLDVLRSFRKTQDFSSDDAHFLKTALAKYLDSSE